MAVQDDKQFMRALSILMGKIAYRHHVQSTYLVDAFFERHSYKWIATFRQEHKKKPVYSAPLNLEISLGEVGTRSPIPRHVPHIQLYGLVEAYAIARSYASNQKQFPSVELFFVGNITDEHPQWEFYYIATSETGQRYYLDLRVDVMSGMIFDVSVAKAAAPYY